MSTCHLAATVVLQAPVGQVFGDLALDPDASVERIWVVLHLAADAVLAFPPVGVAGEDQRFLRRWTFSPSIVPEV